MLLFPAICFMFPPSFLSLCFQPELYHWLIAAIKTGSCWSGKEGYPLIFILALPLLLRTSLVHHYYFCLCLCNLLLYLHLTCSRPSGLVLKTALLIDRSNAGPERNTTTNIGWLSWNLVWTFTFPTWWILFRVLFRVISTWSQTTDLFFFLFLFFKAAFQRQCLDFERNTEGVKWKMIALHYGECRIQGLKLEYLGLYCISTILIPFLVFKLCGSTVLNSFSASFTILGQDLSQRHVFILPVWVPEQCSVFIWVILLFVCFVLNC